MSTLMHEVHALCGIRQEVLLHVAEVNESKCHRRLTESKHQSPVVDHIKK